MITIVGSVKNARRGLVYSRRTEKILRMNVLKVSVIPVFVTAVGPVD
jgi:hypothetical protein